MPTSCKSCLWLISLFAISHFFSTEDWLQRSTVPYTEPSLSKITRNHFLLFQICIFFSGLILHDLSKTFHPVNTPWYFRLSTLDHHSLLAALLCLWPHLGVFQYLFFYYLSFRCSMGFSLPPSLSFYIISATPRFRHHLLMVVYLYIYLAASPSRAPDIHFWIQLKRCHDDVPHSLI